MTIEDGNLPPKVGGDLPPMTDEELTWLRRGAAMGIFGERGDVSCRMATTRLLVMKNEEIGAEDRGLHGLIARRVEASIERAIEKRPAPKKEGA